MNVHLCDPISRHRFHVLFYRLLDAVGQFGNVIPVFYDNGNVRINAVLFEKEADASFLSRNQRRALDLFDRQSDDPVDDARVIYYFTVLFVIRTESEIGHSKRSP